MSSVTMLMCKFTFVYDITGKMKTEQFGFVNNVSLFYAVGNLNIYILELRRLNKKTRESDKDKSVDCK